MDKLLRESRPDYRWAGVDHMPYKEEGSAPFKAISRQVLFAEQQLGCELRYFEMAAGGYSTLERHEHVHAVMILRGRGRCLLGEEVREVGPRDLVTIPSWTWHQFRATEGEPLGFLCMVNAERDRPQLPSEQELATLKTVPQVAEFLAG
ncbi:MAG: cupin domain-containing protein [Alphaproteobacteria bacterium]|nr:cupin domain-containing protein [Alphaproteobacteria bacterium]